MVLKCLKVFFGLEMVEVRMSGLLAKSQREAEKTQVNSWMNGETVLGCQLCQITL